MAEWVFGNTEARTAPCRCCGRETRQLVGSVFEPGSDVPTAFFTTVVTPGHPQPRVKVTLFIGDLSERAQSKDRLIVSMEIWPRGNEYVTTLIDAADSMPPGPEAASPLTAAEVRASAWKETIFSISDAIVRRHASLREHLDQSS